MTNKTPKPNGLAPTVMQRRIVTPRQLKRFARANKAFMLAWVIWMLLCFASVVFSAYRIYLKDGS
jgi:cell division protein FtsL